MNGYLGEFPIDITNMTPADWAIYFIGSYGQIEGEHHKAWVLDQVARILHGTTVISTEAKWDNGTVEFRCVTGEPTPEYHQWVSEGRDGEDGPNTYDYDEGVAP